MVDNIQPYTQLLVGYVLANETIYLIKKKKKNEPIYGMICWFGLPYYVFFFFWEDPYYVERVIIYNFKLVYHLRYKVKISILLQASTF